jgi:hypothetical protein
LPGASVGSGAKRIWPGTVGRQLTVRMGKTLLSEAPESHRPVIRRRPEGGFWYQPDAAHCGHGATARRTRRPPLRRVRDLAA